jgi:hypothetical protein
VVTDRASAPVKLSEPYNCDQCLLPSGEWDPDARSARSCGRSDLVPVPRRPTAILYQGAKSSTYLGRYPDPDLKGEKYLGCSVLPGAPFEDPDDGCPGGWYRSPLVASILPFVRRRIPPDGHRVPNPLFDRAHRLIQEAVLYYELEQERCADYIAKISDDRAKERSKPKAPPLGQGPTVPIGRKRR